MTLLRVIYTGSSTSFSLQCSQTCEVIHIPELTRRLQQVTVQILYWSVGRRCQQTENNARQSLKHARELSVKSKVAVCNI